MRKRKKRKWGREMRSDSRSDSAELIYLFFVVSSGEQGLYQKSGVKLSRIIVCWRWENKQQHERSSAADGGTFTGEDGGEPVHLTWFTPKSLQLVKRMWVNRNQEWQVFCTRSCRCITCWCMYMRSSWCSTGGSAGDMFYWCSSGFSIGSTGFFDVLQEVQVERKFSRGFCRKFST